MTFAWALVLAVATQAAHAGRIVRVYEVGIASAKSPAALQDAIRQVLVRATGRRDAGNDPALASIVGDASRYVQSYRPATDGGTDVVFDGVALEQAIAGAGRNVWERERPFTLVVLHPPLTGSGVDDVRRDLERAAAARGLPVSLVPMSLMDSSGVELDRNTLLASAQRFGGDAVLVGRNDGAGRRWQWTLHAPIASESWSGGIEAGVHGAVDVLARGEAVSFALAEAEALIAVGGIVTLTDYAAVGRLLDAVPGVRRVDVDEAVGTTVTFRVLARGGADGIEQQLAGSSRLTRTGAAGGRLQYQYRR
ncbi:MAG: DUF2066 domain-containing protein [Gammaproteobacteria bacterium]